MNPDTGIAGHDKWIDQAEARADEGKARTKAANTRTDTGVKALQVWRENRDEISSLLTDLVMPAGMTGNDLSQHFLNENPKLKVISMSGPNAEVVGKDFPFAEDINLLTKPFPAQKLAQTVRDRLDAHMEPASGSC